MLVEVWVELEVVLIVLVELQVVVVVAEGEVRVVLLMAAERMPEARGHYSRSLSPRLCN